LQIKKSQVVTIFKFYTEYEKKDFFPLNNGMKWTLLSAQMEATTTEMCIKRIILESSREMANGL
jgi:hypothetical protein